MIAGTVVPEPKTQENWHKVWQRKIEPEWLHEGIVTFSYCTCLDFKYNELFIAVVNRAESFHELTCFLAKASCLFRIKCALLVLQGSNKQLLMSH